MQQLEDSKGPRTLILGAAGVTVLTYILAIFAFQISIENWVLKALIVFVGGIVGIVAAMHIDAKDRTVKGVLLIAGTCALLGAGTAAMIYPFLHMAYDWMVLISAGSIFAVALVIKYKEMPPQA